MPHPTPWRAQCGNLPQLRNWMSELCHQQRDHQNKQMIKVMTALKGYIWED